MDKKIVDFNQNKSFFLVQIILKKTFTMKEQINLLQELQHGSEISDMSEIWGLLQL